MKSIESIEDFPGWPSGDDLPMLEIALSTRDIEALFSVRFFDFIEAGLGRVQMAGVLDPVIGPVVLKSFLDAPKPGGLLVCVDSKVDPAECKARLRTVFKLKSDDIVWENFASTGE